jgi:hypothetical protein
MGAPGNKAAGSAATAALESEDLSSLAAPVEGLAASLAKRLNAGTRKTAIVAMAIIFTLNLTVAS